MKLRVRTTVFGGRMFWCAALALLTTSGLAQVPAAQATIWYVRTDGGTAAQCTGTKDVAYRGSGGAQACAWDSIQEALPPGYTGNGVAKVRVKDGDRVIIDAGTYMMGYGSPGASACQKNYTNACTLQQPMPNHLTIEGASCSSRPVLWGTERLGNFFNVSGTTGTTIKCLEITDHSMCIEDYRPTTNTGGVTACVRNTYPHGTWAESGIYASGAADLKLSDLNIHGLALYGIVAGKLTGTTTVTNVTIRANGWGGWNGDLGGNDHTSADSGTLTFTNLDVEWNGCAEAYPSATIVGCWGQNEGGYGDGFSEAWTGGNWVFTKSSFNYNTQDGLDLLYANGTGTISIDQITASQNAGNDIKTSGNATITNSVFNNNCSAFQDLGYPAGGTSCRADGSEAFDLDTAGQTLTFAYNTVTGNGDCLITGDPAAGPTDVYNISNNIFIGQISYLPRNEGQYTCLGWFGDTQTATVNYVGNVVWHVRHSVCPAGSICKDPQLTNETLAGFNPMPLPTSPVVDTANNKITVPVDRHGNSRPQGRGYDIGAIEVMDAKEHAPSQKKPK